MWLFQVAISLQSTCVKVLQPAGRFKKATEHLQNWHAASEQATSSHMPTGKTASPSMSTNVQPVFDI